MTWRKSSISRKVRSLNSFARRRVQMSHARSCPLLVLGFMRVGKGAEAPLGLCELVGAVGQLNFVSAHPKSNDAVELLADVLDLDWALREGDCKVAAACHEGCVCFVHVPNIERNFHLSSKNEKNFRKKKPPDVSEGSLPVENET